MATIFELKAANTAPRGGTERRTDGACEIILFPGVRYERWTEPAAAPKAAAPMRKARNRKRELEMAD